MTRPIRKFPRIVHLMYFPWDKNQNLKINENDFDLSFYKEMLQQNPDWDIKLWTLSKTREFVEHKYPGLWSHLWSLFSHPVQAVDFFRLLVVFELGGIYWQYESEQLVDLQKFRPRWNSQIRLFVERTISRDFSRKMATQPIRNGKPEEICRICNQIFSAYPRNGFLQYCINKSKNNLLTSRVSCDYDILYIGANAMISEAYHEYKNHGKIQLTSKKQRKRMIRLACRGSWRTEEL